MSKLKKDVKPKRTTRKPVNSPKKIPVKQGQNKEYKVGYKNPPKEYQWKPGQSGNPSGRAPRNNKELDAMIDTMLAEPTTVKGKKYSNLEIALNNLLFNRNPSGAMYILDRRFGKTPQFKDEGDGEARQLVLTPDLLTSDFLAAYRDIMAGNHTEYTFDGGRGGLKSTFISEIITVLLCNNPDTHALILRQIKNDLRDSVYSQFIWSISILGISHLFDPKVSPMEITYLPTGQKIYFRGADKPESIKSIKPPFGYIGLLWFEEFDQFKGEAAIRNIVQSALRGGDKAWRFESWNTPRSKNHWVHRYMKLPKDNRFHTTANYLNVPREWLGEIFIEEAETLRELNPKAYDHEYGGIAIGEGGVVFDNIELRTITDQEIEEFEDTNQGLDWGFVHPLAYIKGHYSADNLTIYIFDELRAVRKRNEEAYKLLVEDKKIDPNDLMIADSEDQKSIKDFRSYGINIRGAEKGKNSREYSFRWLQGRVKIVIDPKRCPHTAEQFTEYESTMDKNGDVIDEYPKKNDDFIDAVRYAFNLIWRVGGQ